MGRLESWDRAVERWYATAMQAPDGSAEERDALQHLHELVALADEQWRKGARITERECQT